MASAGSVARCALLSIGDEIVSGATPDTNASWLAERLRAEGVEPTGILGVADDPAAIVRAMRRGLEDAELVVATGGLGPTPDDLTAAAAAEVAGRPLGLRREALAEIEARFAASGRPMPPSNRKQAEIPTGALLLPNPDGTAPGFLCPAPRSRGSAGWIAALPGVPAEMRAITRAHLLPWLRDHRPDRSFASRTFSTFGLSESQLGERLAGLVGPGEGRLSFRAAFPRIQARVTVAGPHGSGLEAHLDEIEARIRERLGRTLYAVGDVGMEEVVGQLLRERGYTLAVAESCTGGRIGDRITDVPGSGEYLLLDVVAYQDRMKTELLDVPPQALAAHGAVSVEVVEAMARGALRRAAADLAVATSGIAGPGGGSREKPIGTVCVGLAWPGGTWSRRYDLGDAGRERIKAWAAQIALDRVRRHLLRPD